jgi:hypothetical protein
MLLALRARALAPLLRTTNAACTRCQHVAAKVQAALSIDCHNAHACCALAGLRPDWLQP